MFPQDGSKHGQISEALLCGVKVERCGSRASDSEVRLQAPELRRSTLDRVCMCACMRVCVHACVHVRVCTHMCCVCACICVCTRVCTRVCVRVRVHGPHQQSCWNMCPVCEATQRGRHRGSRLQAASFLCGALLFGFLRARAEGCVFGVTSTTWLLATKYLIVSIPARVGQHSFTDAILQQMIKSQKRHRTAFQSQGCSNMEASTVLSRDAK